MQTSIGHTIAEEKEELYWEGLLVRCCGRYCQVYSSVARENAPAHHQAQADD